MSNREIDIREFNSEKIKLIKFADKDSQEFIATTLSLLNTSVAIQEDEGDGDHVRIINKEQAFNLIKALEKAIELGWFDKISS